MDIFKSVSDTIAGFFKRHKSADPVDKQDILNIVDNNLITLKLVVDTFEQNADLLKFIQTELLSANRGNTGLRTLYDTYVSGLNSVARQQENTSFLRSIYTATKFVLADNQAIRDNFDLLFKDGTDVGEISLEQMKLSHATVFGFINLSSLLADWFCFFIGQVAGQPAEVARVPAYREAVVRDSSRTVGDFVNDVLLRGSSRNIIALVQSVKQAGDVAIYTESATLNSYASINDYPGVAKFVGAFGSFQPILLVREFFSNFARVNYKRNLAMREWMQSKIIILRMDADKMDPNSPEYQRQLKILQRYSDELAKLDRKIANYEKV